jgi:hypothetical protein
MGRPAATGTNPNCHANRELCSRFDLVSIIANHRIALWALTIPLLAIIAFTSFFGVQSFTWWKVRQLEKSDPVVSVTPQVLRDTAPSNQPGLKLSAYGYEFEVPWRDIENDKTRSGDFVTLYYFQSGQFLMFSNPDKAANVRGILLADDEKRKAAMQVWGEKAIESNFAWMKAALETSPAEMSVFAPRLKMVHLVNLLVLKSIFAMGGETGVFAVDTSTVRGFQMGDPDKRPKVIFVRAFDMDDHQLELTFGVQKGSTGQITQADINRVLQTVRRQGTRILRAPRVPSTPD